MIMIMMTTGTGTTELRLFFYGTLRPDAGTPMARWIAQRVIRAEPGWVPGRLHALQDARGWYPALVVGQVRGQTRTQGVLCDLRLTPGELALLDRYEGREYRRRALPVRIGAVGMTSRRGVAQAYIWNMPLPAASRLIDDGDFAGWLARTGCRAFL